MTETDLQTLCDTVRQTCDDLHSRLGTGFPKEIYETGLDHRLQTKGVAFERRKTLPVTDADGTRLGNWVADLLIANEILVEIAVLPGIGRKHLAQASGRLRACGIPCGLLINFGARRLEIHRLTP